MPYIGTRKALWLPPRRKDEDPTQLRFVFGTQPLASRRIGEVRVGPGSYFSVIYHTDTSLTIDGTAGMEGMTTTDATSNISSSITTPGLTLHASNSGGVDVWLPSYPQAPVPDFNGLSRLTPYERLQQRLQQIINRRRHRHE
jgi:hypothetical protein